MADHRDPAGAGDQRPASMRSEPESLAGVPSLEELLAITEDSPEYLAEPEESPASDAAFDRALAQVSATRELYRRSRALLPDVLAEVSAGFTDLVRRSLPPARADVFAIARATNAGPRSLVLLAAGDATAADLDAETIVRLAREMHLSASTLEELLAREGLAFGTITDAQADDVRSDGREVEEAQADADANQRPPGQVDRAALASEAELRELDGGQPPAPRRRSIGSCPNEERRAQLRRAWQLTGRHPE